MKETIKIDGMSCGHCVAAVRQAVTEIEGVAVSAVEIGSATIEYDPSAVEKHAIVAAIAEEGFVVSTD